MTNSTSAFATSVVAGPARTAAPCIAAPTSRRSPSTAASRSQFLGAPVAFFAERPSASFVFVSPRAHGGHSEKDAATQAVFDKAAAALSAGAKLALTVENVDRVLDQIRPALIADGGNVTVRSAESGFVALKLEGRCGMCASSTQTLKNGIEKTLRSAFPDLKQVVAVQSLTEEETFSMPTISIEECEAALDKFRPALAHVGGSVTVEAVAGLDVFLKYSGPADFRDPTAAILKENVPNVRDVRLVN
eukprot:tig00021123_g18494.t1